MGGKITELRVELTKVVVVCPYCLSSFSYRWWGSDHCCRCGAHFPPDVVMKALRAFLDGTENELGRMQTPEEKPPIGLVAD